jgi:hypothetical protein
MLTAIASANLILSGCSGATRVLQKSNATIHTLDISIRD